MLEAKSAAPLQERAYVLLRRVHATSVLQVMHLLMHQGGLIQLGVLQNVMVLACYLASICHDFQHPGVNNDFLIKTNDRKALMYNVSLKGSWAPRVGACFCTPVPA